MKISAFERLPSKSYGATITLMQTEQIVALLVAERDRLNRAIEALQGSSIRRGRAKSASAPAPAAAAAAPKRKRKGMTASQRKAHSERMKAFWAARRKKAKA
jgi:hypothetical protein